MSKIARFEAIAERMVEGTFARLFDERLQAHEVSLHLARAMEDHQLVTPEGIHEAPTHYTIHIHPDALSALAAERPALERELAKYVAELAAQAGLLLPISPLVQLLPGDGLAPHQVEVEAHVMSDQQPEVERTQGMEASAPTTQHIESTPPGRPFLVLEGRRHVNLTQPVISIGRSLDNDIVMEDSRVSRQHAQLRRRYERYVLYDLGSRGGTRINGYPIEECVLHSGDVISLAGVEIVYGEDAPTPPPLSGCVDTPTMTLRPAQESDDSSG